MNTTATSANLDRLKKAASEARIDLYRWERYTDGDNKLWIITCLFRKGVTSVPMVELLDVDAEATIDEERTTVEAWIRAGTLQRLTLPIIP
ncbi:hypothetical protein GCM10028805_47210 [Spirosoma harenae]